MGALLDLRTLSGGCRSPNALVWQGEHGPGSQPTASDHFLVRELEAEGFPLTFLPHHTLAEEAEKAGIKALGWRMWPVVRADDSCFCHLFPYWDLPLLSI